MAVPVIRKSDDLIANGYFAYPFTYLFHDPRQITAFSGREGGRIYIFQLALPDHAFPDVDTCSPDPNHYLPYPGNRPIDFNNIQYVHSAKVVKFYRTRMFDLFHNILFFACNG